MYQLGGIDVADFTFDLTVADGDVEGAVAATLHADAGGASPVTFAFAASFDNDWFSATATAPLE